MSWTRILLNKDQIETGEIKKFQQEFRDAFHSAGLPEEMGLFADHPNSNGELPFYLTPACSRFAASLISDYSGIACEKPVKKALGPTLVIGLNRAWALLLE